MPLSWARRSDARFAAEISKSDPAECHRCLPPAAGLCLFTAESNIGNVAAPVLIALQMRA